MKPSKPSKIICQAVVFAVVFDFHFRLVFRASAGGGAGQESVCWIVPPSIILGGN